jgi:hypothetical protein
MVACPHGHHLCSSVFPQPGTLSAVPNDRRRSDRDAARLLTLRHEGNRRCTQMHTNGSCSGGSVRARRPIGRNWSWRPHARQVTGPGRQATGPDRWYYPPDSQTNRRGLKRCWPASAGTETAGNTTCPSAGDRQPPQPVSVALRVPRSSSVLRFSVASAKKGARQIPTHRYPPTVPHPSRPDKPSTAPSTTSSASKTGLRASTLK